MDSAMTPSAEAWASRRRLRRFGAGVMMLIVLSLLVTRFAGAVAPGPSAGAGFGFAAAGGAADVCCQ